jgi:hypothetical protein
VAETAREVMVRTEYEILGGPLGELLADRIPKAAVKAHRRYPQVPAEDFEQAMWERALKRGPHFRKLYEDGRYGIIWEELRRAGSKLGKSDDRWRRNEKAWQAGYDKDDEAFYSTRNLGLLLPVLIDADFDVSAVIERATQGTDKAGIRHHNPDPFAAELYPVTLIDVVTAFGRLPEGMQRLLKTYYGVNQEDTDAGRWDREKLASSMGLTRDALAMRAHRALIRLQWELGGEDPWPRRR